MGYHHTPLQKQKERIVKMGVAFFGFGLFVVIVLIGWPLEKIGLLETPAHSPGDFAESSPRENGGAR